MPASGNNWLLKLKLLAVRLLEPVTRLRHALSAPRMLWGYRNRDGSFRTRTRISSTAFLKNPSNIDVADNVFIWHYTIVDGTERVTIGEGTQIGAWVAVFTHSSHLSIRMHGKNYVDVHEADKIGFVKGAVSIGPYVFLGAGAQVFPGTSIGRGAIITANSVVKWDVPDFAIVAGNPAKLVGDTRLIDKPLLQKFPELQSEYTRWQQSDCEDSE